MKKERKIVPITDFIKKDFPTLKIAKTNKGILIIIMVIPIGSENK